MIQVCDICVCYRWTMYDTSVWYRCIIYICLLQVYDTCICMIHSGIWFRCMLQIHDTCVLYRSMIQMHVSYAWYRCIIQMCHTGAWMHSGIWYRCVIKVYDTDAWHLLRCILLTALFSWMCKRENVNGSEWQRRTANYWRQDLAYR